VSSRLATRAAIARAAEVAVLALLLTGLVGACGSSGSAASPSADPAKDKLAQILQRGTLVGYAELDYPPQSIKVDGAVRATTTKCLPNQITAQEVTGFDIETTKLVAKGLGVEVCFVQPTWTEVTSGNWNDHFDLVYGSGAINATRMEHLWMTQPYYFIPQRFVVRADSSYQKPSDLDGKSIGTCTSCTVESYLKGTLQIPGVDLVRKVKDPKLVGFETEFPGLDALAAGDLDAFLTAEPVGLQAIEDGRPLRLLDETAFSMYPSGFVDKGSGLDVRAFVARVDEIIRKAHADGTLKAMSEQWFGTDYATPAGAFDLTKLGQAIK
jgi:polar amino acid transport system substrate-binding protein